MSRAANISAKTIDTERLSTHILTAGDGDGVPVLFVHGNLSTSAFWKDTIATLADTHKSVAMDLRGFGDSEPAAIDATRGVRDFSDDLHALITSLGFDSVHLVGWSVGGGVVMQYAIDHADRVESLTLVAPMNARAAREDAGDWSSPGLRSAGDAAAYVKTPSGLVYEDVNRGEGEPAASGDIAVFEYVMRRANGYFIYGTIDCGIGCGNGDPYEAKLGPSGRLIPGLDELLTGMRPGGKRKALIKPELAYRDGPTTLLPQPPEYGQRRQIQRVSSSQQGEPLIFEVRLIKTRQGA